MRPHPSEELLNDYVDDLLDPGRRQELERHVADCPECARTIDELRALLRRAAALPGVAPDRDLWPGVRAGIAAGGSPAPRWILAAAALLVVGLALAVLLVGRPSDPGPPARSAERRNALFLAELAAAERQYVEATDRLLGLLEQRRAEIPAATLRVLDENLQVIDRAIDQTRAAVESQGAGAGDGHRLAALYGKKLELLLRASRLATEGRGIQS